MKFIYFYSDLYEFYHNHINNNLNSLFELDPCKIDDLTNKGGHTFSGGVSVKIEIIINKIKENMGTSIVFTDATIWINSNKKHELVEFFNKYLENDLCFADNCINTQYNIGIILIKCNTKTLQFFENVLCDLVKSSGWDQNIVNKWLNIDDLKINKFDKEKIYCNYHFNPSYRDSFLIYKSFISHTKDVIKNFNSRLDIFKKYQLITDEEYNSNYK